MQARTLVAIAFAIAVPTGPAGATDYYWPGSPPCTSTLQACIDIVPDGNAVVVARDTPIDETLNLFNRSLTVRAAAGYRPSLAAGNWITISTPPIGTTQTVTLSGFTLTDGFVSVTHNGSGAGVYDIREMTLQSTGSGLGTYISVRANNGPVTATVYHNTVEGTPLDADSGIVEFVARSAELDANVFYNRVRSRSRTTQVTGSGVLVDVADGASGTAKLHANDVRGSFLWSSILVREGAPATVASDYNARLYNNVTVCSANAIGWGYSFGVTNGGINAQVVNNTISRCSTGIDTYRRSGASGSVVGVDGIVKNNLVVAPTTLSFPSTVSAALQNDYNLLNGSTSVVTGANTITAPAQLVDSGTPRLRATSPARDAADTSTLGLGLIFAGMPVTDADGKRRLKNAGDADIGAYEYGDRRFLHTATPTNTGTYISTMDDPAANGQITANLIATPNFNAGGTGGTSNNNPFGVYYASSRWRVFNEDATTPINNNVKFNVFAPMTGDGSFRHAATAANTSGRFTTIDSGSTNGVGGYIVLATQNWSEGSNVYNAHPIGVNYDATNERWQIANLDAAGATMPAGAGFNVYAQPPSPNAFRVTTVGSTTTLPIDHPLLDGVPCAQVNVTRVWSGSTVSGNYDVSYSHGSGRWMIFAFNPMPTGTTFNVVVDPEQIDECTDRIFANGYE